MATFRGPCAFGAARPLNPRPVRPTPRARNGVNGPDAREPTTTSSPGLGFPTAAAGPAHPWDGFIDGPENALAHASLLALARGDGQGVSPLVVHGGAGVGKSRLLRGLVGECLLRRP